MVTREDLDSYFIRMNLDLEEVEENMWMIKTPQDGVPIIVHYTPPVLVMRIKVLDLPEDKDDVRLAPLYRRLLELNAADIVHGSYGIDENEIVLSDALELEDLDFSELRSSYESMLFALSSHVPQIAELVDGGRPVAQGG